MFPVRWTRVFALALLFAGWFELPAHAQVTSATYDPAWPAAIHCPAAIRDQQLSSLFTIVGDNEITKSGDIGDRFIDCKYGNSVRITVSWATHDNPGDEAQWCGLTPVEDDGLRVYLHSPTRRADAP